MPLHIAPNIIIDATLDILMVFSLITWTLIFFKIWQFAKNSYYNKQFNAAFWNAADLKTAERLPVEIARGPKARIAVSGFLWLAEKNQSDTPNSLKFMGSPHELLEQTLRKQTHIEQTRMESGLTMLASIGSTAPFVGLFGTVVGIMNAMHDISAKGSASLDVVAGPIGDALIATAIGIAVAVPAVLAYNFFIRRAKHQRAALEHFVGSFLHIALGDKTAQE
jgi:biopolymer transport protein ExbB